MVEGGVTPLILSQERAYIGDSQYKDFEIFINLHMVPLVNIISSDRHSDGQFSVPSRVG